MPAQITDFLIAQRLSVIGKLTLQDVKDLFYPPVSQHDFWFETSFGSNNAAANDFFVGAAISSGTNTTAIPSVDAVIDGLHIGGVFLRSSTTANGGYRYQTSSLITMFFGKKNDLFKATCLWRTSFTGRTVRLGFHDTANSNDAVDGAYFEVINGVVSCKTANNSTRTTAPTTLQLSLDVWYSFEITASLLGDEVNFKVFNDTTNTELLSQTILTNIPTTRARAFGAGIVATESTTTASDILVLSYMGVGTVPFYNRLRG